MLKVQLTHPKAIFYKATEGSAAFDLAACIDDDYWLPPNETVKVSAGVKLELPKDTAAFLLPRSGLGSTGLVLGNLVGLIDTDYTNGIKLVLWNRTDEPILIKSGMRVAQLMLMPVVQVQYTLEDEIPDSVRDGFGSTGI